MKIALVRRHFSATGGAELYLQRLLEGLVGAGHEVHLFAEAWPELPVSVRVHLVSAPGARSIRPRLFALAVDLELRRQPFDCVLSLERTLRQDVYRAGDGVHRVWVERRRQFASWWRKPFVGWGGFHRTILALEAATFNPANTRHVLVNSNLVRREIREHFGFPDDRIHLVRNGVEVERFRGGQRAATRARFGVRDVDSLLLFVGSGWERKGLKFLLRAFSVLGSRPGPGGGEIKLLVVGKGRRPLHVPANVIFVGPMAEVENAYAAADLFTFLPIYEPAANVTFEALAAGLPVVTSAQNGASELIREGGNGTVLPRPDDQARVVEAIQFWLSRPRRLSSVDLAALSIETNVAETLVVLEMAAKENSPRRAA